MDTNEGVLGLMHTVGLSPDPPLSQTPSPPPGPALPAGSAGEAIGVMEGEQGAPALSAAAAYLAAM